LSGSVAFENIFAPVSNEKPSISGYVRAGETANVALSLLACEYPRATKICSTIDAIALAKVFELIPSFGLVVRLMIGMEFLSLWFFSLG
jgi:hypothetical protein